MLTTPDLHWLAGFIDGEGYFGIQKSNPKVVVAQKDIWPLLKVQKLLGGNLYYVKGSCKDGRFYNVLHINGKRAAGVMMTLYSLLSPRRQEKVASILNKWRSIPLRGEFHRSQSHCKRGHEFSVENTYLKKDGGRQCKTCQAVLAQKHYLKLKASLS